MKQSNYRQILNTSILVILFIGISGVIPLVNSEFADGNACPKIIGIPACYIILICLSTAIISHANLITDKDRLYFIGVIIAFSIATFGSISNFMGYLECPKTENDVPMCYLSFLLFLSLLILKIILKRKPATQVEG